MIMSESILKIIIESSLTAGIAAAAVILIRPFMKKAPKRWSYMLWAIVFFRCLCPFSAESAVSLFNAFPAHETQLSQPVRQEAEDVSVESDGNFYSDPDADTIFPYVSNVYGETRYADYRAYADFNKNGAETSETSESGGAGTKAAAAPDGTDPETESASSGKYAAALAVWAVGAALMTAYSAISYARLMKKLKTAVKAEDGAYETDLIPTAFSAGFPPQIYLPCGLSETERKLIVVHEKVHIRRLDYISKLLAFAALTIHWFNPLIWASFALMTRDMELSCDEAVLKICGAQEKKAYSRALLRVSMKRSGLAALPLAFAESGIKGRVQNVLEYKKPRVFATLIAAAMVVSACAVLGTNAVEAPDDEDSVPVTAPAETQRTDSEDISGERVFPPNREASANPAIFTEYSSEESGADGDVKAIPENGYGSPVRIEKGRTEFSGSGGERVFLSYKEELQSNLPNYHSEKMTYTSFPDGMFACRGFDCADTPALMAQVFSKKKSGGESFMGSSGAVPAYPFDIAILSSVEELTVNDIDVIYIDEDIYLRIDIDMRSEEEWFSGDGWSSAKINLMNAYIKLNDFQQYENDPFTVSLKADIKVPRGNVGYELVLTGFEDIPIYAEGNAAAKLVSSVSNEEFKRLFEELLSNSGGAKSQRPELGYPISDEALERCTYGANDLHVLFAVPKRTEVAAAADGTVKSTAEGWNNGYGNCAEISHENGITTLYAHLDEISVQVGSEVKAGDVIGYSGSSGATVGDALLFEIRLNDEIQSPWDYFHFSGDNYYSAVDKINEGFIGDGILGAYPAAEN